MNENIKAFLIKVAGSEELQAKFTNLTTPEEAYEVAKTIQDGFTKEEFLEAAQAMAAGENGDISDEILASAAGGSMEVPDDFKIDYNQPLSAFSKNPQNWVTAGGPAFFPNVTK